MGDERVERIAEFIKPLRVKPGSKLNLGKDFDSKEEQRKAPATRPATRTGAAGREQRTRPPR